MVRTPRHGLTWIEVLVIIAIIGVVISLILPATRRIREPAERMSCSNNLKYLMMALHSFDSMGSSAQMASASEPDAHADQVFPPGCLGPGTTPEERLSWMVALLPYVEEGSLHQRFDLHKGYAGNRAAAQMGIRVFLCPAAKDVVFTDAVTTYVAMAGIGHDAATQPAGAAGNGFMGYDRRTSLKMITDGTSNTIGLMETRFELGPWARGGSSTLRGFEPAGASLQGDNPPFGGHANGMNAAMADGSVRFLSPSIDPKIFGRYHDRWRRIARSELGFAVTHRILTTALRWLTAVLILRVLATILANYPDYFPPNFESLFLQGREGTFRGAYRVAFYVHIFTGPVILLNGLILLSESVRRRHRGWHRWLGRVQVVVLLLFVLPSSVVMARHAFGGPVAGLSFLLLSVATASCAIMGVVHACRRRFDRHRRWMLRCYVLICSAVALRLISGAAGLVGASRPEQAYIVAAWSSWLLPLAAYEITERLRCGWPDVPRSARLVSHFAQQRDRVAPSDLCRRSVHK